MQRRVDVDRVSERLGVELLDDVLVVELCTVSAGDGKGEERVDVDGEEGAESGGVGTGEFLRLEDDADLDESRLDVVELNDERELGAVSVDVLLHLVLRLRLVRLCDATTSRGLDIDPLNTVDVRDLRGEA